MAEGIKETRELALAVCKVGCKMVEVLKDGAQTADLVALFEVAGDVFAGIQGIDQIPDELTNLTPETKNELGDILAEHIEHLAVCLKGS